MGSTVVLLKVLFFGSGSAAAIWWRWVERRTMRQIQARADEAELLEQEAARGSRPSDDLRDPR